MKKNILAICLLFLSSQYTLSLVKTPKTAADHFKAASPLNVISDGVSEVSSAWNKFIDQYRRGKNSDVCITPYTLTNYGSVAGAMALLLKGSGRLAIITGLSGGIVNLYARWKDAEEERDKQTERANGLESQLDQLGVVNGDGLLSEEDHNQNSEDAPEDRDSV